MTGANQSSTNSWAIRRAMILGAACLVVGIAGGWSIRGWESPLAKAPVATAAPAATQNAIPQATDPARMKAAADAQAGPLLEQLKSDPNNAQLLTGVANLYYDAQQYQTAIDYYGSALKANPSDAAVRTDMATAYWYVGNADSAIAEFDKALTYQPNNPNTLFNRGMVKWQGKMDGPGALADWKQLLATTPDYEAKDKVQQMIAEVEKHGAGGR